VVGKEVEEHGRHGDVGKQGRQLAQRVKRGLVDRRCEEADGEQAEERKEQGKNIKHLPSRHYLLEQALAERAMVLQGFA